MWATDVGLHVVDTGEPDGRQGAPLVLFVHGYPDTHMSWEAVVRLLAPSMRCVAYDVRGFGLSDKPVAVEAYAVGHLLDDLVAVLDDVGASARRPVHLVGHDWGSVQLWEAVQAESTDARLTGRIATYTSISGPGLDHVAVWMRRTAGRARHDRQARRDLARQARKSWYIGAFQIPVVPGMVMKQAVGKSLSQGNRRLRRDFDGTLPEDLDHGTKLYRANMRGPRREATVTPTRVPVQLVELAQDRYITPAVLDVVDEFASRLTRVRLEAGHWAPKTHPGEVADLVRSFVEAP